MTKPTGQRKTSKTMHTMETLFAKTIEVGNCLEWQGYTANGVPMICHAGKMVSVRKLMLDLQGVEVKKGAQMGCTCLSRNCVEPSHIVQRDKKQHAKHMSLSPNRNETARIAKMTATSRKTRAKITIDQAREARASEEAHHVIAARFGVSRGIVTRIRAGTAWKEHTSPFAGLGAR